VLEGGSEGGKGERQSSLIKARGQRRDAAFDTSDKTRRVKPAGTNTTKSDGVFNGSTPVGKGGGEKKIAVVEMILKKGKCGTYKKTRAWFVLENAKGARQSENLREGNHEKKCQSISNPLDKEL